MSALPATKAMTILLVEDNADDVFLTQEAFGSLETPPQFILCEDGVAAIEYLESRLPGQQALPDLILLDLNMPRLDGFGFLERLKQHAELRCLPVLIFSTSDSTHDVRRSYDGYANSYICKPRLFSDYDRVVQAVHAFWLQTARLPAALN